MAATAQLTDDYHLSLSIGKGLWDDHEAVASFAQGVAMAPAVVAMPEKAWLK